MLSSFYEISVRNCHFMKFPCSQWQNVRRHADISVSVCHEYISWITMACLDRFMYIDRLINVSILNVFCKHNVVHLCMFNLQHTVGYLYNYSIAPFTFKNKVIIITTFNSYWYCYFHFCSCGNFHKIISSLPLRNHYHCYQYNHHYHCNITMTESCCYQLIVTYWRHIVSWNLVSIVSDTGASPLCSQAITRRNDGLMITWTP